MVKRRYLIKQNEGARLVLSITVSIFSSFLFLFCLLQPILLGQAERERYLHSASNLTTLLKHPGVSSPWPTQVESQKLTGTQWAKPQHPSRL